MDVREKLVELIRNAFAAYGDGITGCTREEFFADFIASNGATVQEWISVRDKYPNHGDVVLICTKDKDIHTFQWDAVYDGWVGDRYNFSKRMVTHWMPLPDAPKGE